jgi:capsular exopolysaccharide synthesis family protein
MTNTEDPNLTFAQDDELPSSTKEYLYRFLNQWYWFVLSVILGFGGGYLYNLYQVPVYQVGTTILVKQDNQSNSIIGFFEENWGTYSLIDNQIGIIKSYTLSRQTMEALKWRVNWYRKGMFTQEGIYKSEPFNLAETPGKENMEGVPLTIKVLSPTTFMVSFEPKTKFYRKNPYEAFSKECRFGVPFTSALFHFTLTLKEGAAMPEAGTEFIIYFNNLNSLVGSYLGKLNVAKLSENSEILSLTVNGNEPYRDLDYLNELTKTYIQYGLNEKNKTSENAIRFIDMQLSSVGDSLHHAAQKFSDFRSSNKILDLTQEGSMVVSKLAELQKEKAMSDMRLKYFRNLKNYLGNGEQMKQVVAPSIVGITDPIFNNLVMNLIELYAKREVLSYSANENSPNFQILENEIKMTRKNLDESLRNIMANAESEANQIDEQILKASSEIAHLPAIEQQMIGIQGRFEMNKEMSDFLQKKRAEAAISLASNAPDAFILDAAYPETINRLGPQKSKFYMFGILIGLLVPMLIIFVYDYLNDKIRSMEQLERKTKLPIVGSIAHNNYDTDFPVVEHPKAAISESFRGLRTNLKFMLPGPAKKVIAVHSTIPGEGKTFVSINLASIIALNNLNVLLVGCDMRKPSLQKLFDQNDTIGLSNYLIGQVTLEDIVQLTKVKGLSFVPSGQIPPNPAELLENPLFDQFLDEVRARFDIIIMDNAPISIITDSVIVGRKADANLFILRQEFSHRDQIKFVNELARQDKLRSIAIALNDVQVKGYGYGSRRYGGYYNNYKYGGSYYSDIPKQKMSKRLLRKLINDEQK